MVLRASRHHSGAAARAASKSARAMRRAVLSYSVHAGQLRFFELLKFSRPFFPRRTHALKRGVDAIHHAGRHKKRVVLLHVTGIRAKKFVEVVIVRLVIVFHGIVPRVFHGEK